MVERSPVTLPLPPRAKNQLPGEGAELPPGDAKGQQTKGAGGRRSGTVPGPGSNLRPRDGPRSANGSLQMAMVVSRAAVPGLSHGLIPARGWDGTMLGNQGAVVTLLAIPRHVSPSASPNRHHPNAP